LFPFLSSSALRQHFFFLLLSSGFPFIQVRQTFFPSHVKASFPLSNPCEIAIFPLPLCPHLQPNEQICRTRDSPLPSSPNKIPLCRPSGSARPEIPPPPLPSGSVKFLLFRHHANLLINGCVGFQTWQNFQKTVCFSL